MFFEIENTPEHIKRARRKEALPKASPKEECPRLILAPFSRPPQVIFDNVLIGSTCERNLEVLNPTKQVQQITLGRALPPGLVIQLPEEWLEVEPETCYCLTMQWTPMQPTALREIIRFTNESRGRYDVTVVLKSAIAVKGKGNQLKTFKTSPGKMKRKVIGSKRSPGAVYKKKAEVIYNTTKIKKSISVVQSTEHRVYKQSNKENFSHFNDYSIENQQYTKCPFDSPTSIDLNFDTSEIFSNMRKPKSDNHFNTYEKSPHKELAVPENILKPSNKQLNTSASDIFDNMTFTPLKSFSTKAEKLNKGPQIVLSMDSVSDLDDSLNMNDKENGPYSIICVSSTQPTNTWLTAPHNKLDDQCIETPNVANKKIPNTSSPKELNSPNFSINTDFSRISELSFLPQRTSTERKMVPRPFESHDFFEDHNSKLNSDTYTKDSPNTPMHPPSQVHGDIRPPFYLKENPKLCRQSLFREYQQQQQRDTYDTKSYPYHSEPNVWQSTLRSELKSPPRSMSPPLQSIPEECTELFETQILDKTAKQNTFTINRTFDKGSDRNTNKQSWSKKAVRAEPELWKMPVPLPKKSSKPKKSVSTKDSIDGKLSSTFEANKSSLPNITLNQIGNIYSQSSTVDPFLSATYFYDEEAVDKFETDFKKWLNCILTPPADLDSNIEQKVDVGKAWLENRNKDVPLAPTREQVSSAYHNSHRLISLRKSAKALLMSPEIVQVMQKLNAQIEKKLIAVRTDRNLHLDVGLQKAIMELLLSYNPLWLRIGLEAIYNVVLPLKSNSDIEGLTTFIIQRMFKNPHLKCKHTKSNAPNMLLPAYMEAIKKFTLKKFFMLVFFLDQAKQRKLISHDPCLFCRNAVCKESREVIIRFTRDLIAGIGDITKHLRPLGYVVSHKQSYLDEYKYAVHNIAVDIRDGVRLTKVMEIILLKNGLLNQLRTPAISRLQKIHNVQVALNALKESNFVITGDITSNDIADGHREKTLSLLWQIIHVFRAPLFEKAANIIQTWWKKKYEVIVEKRKEEERVLQVKHNAASLIQTWWRRIKYNRLMEHQMEQITKATLVIQKYYRMWLCRTRLLKTKRSVLKIEEWYTSIKMMRQAKETLSTLKAKRDELRHRSATLIQSYFKRWLCMREYKIKIKKIVVLQSLIRCFLLRKWFTHLKTTTTYIQQKYRGKLLMRKEMHKFSEMKQSAIIIQSYYKMLQQRRLFNKAKEAVKTLEERYLALLKMRKEMEKYRKLKQMTIKLQAIVRSKRCRRQYLKERDSIVRLQLRVKAHILMKKEKSRYILLRRAAIVIQNRFRALQAMRKDFETYSTQRRSAILIQQYFRSYLMGKSQRTSYTKLKNAVVIVQTRFRGLLAMRKERCAYNALKKAVIDIQQRFRANLHMKKERESYNKLRCAALILQRRYRAHTLMKQRRAEFLKIKTSCVTIQNAYRAKVLAKKQKQEYTNMRQSAILIQKWYRSIKITSETKQEFQQTRQACVMIQRTYRAIVIGRKQRQEYLRIRTATIRIQNYYRSYVEMRLMRDQYTQIKTATVTIQRNYKAYVETKKQRLEFEKIKLAARTIQNYYRRYKLAKLTKMQFSELKKAAVNVQRRYRSICAMRIQRDLYLKLKQATVAAQRRFRALQAMKLQRELYLKLRSSALILQAKFRAQQLMKKEKQNYATTLKACVTIQRFYRAYKIGTSQKKEYMRLKNAALVIQSRYRARLAMKRERISFLRVRTAVIRIQVRYRANLLMKNERSQYQNIQKSVTLLQRLYRARLSGKKQQTQYTSIKHATILIQKWYKNILVSRKIRHDYMQLRNSVVFIQREFRAKLLAREKHRNNAAKKIQVWYKYIRLRNEEMNKYRTLKYVIIMLQSLVRMRTQRKNYLAKKAAAMIIQKRYRAYKCMAVERTKYIQLLSVTIIIQSYVRRFIHRTRYTKIRSAVVTIQRVFRLKLERELIKKQRDEAAICIQKNVRCYLARSHYEAYRKKIVLLQKVWRGKLMTRFIRCDFMQKRNMIIKLQALIRGHLVRKQVQIKKQEIVNMRELRRQHWAASVIQAMYRGHKVRMAVSADRRVAELRKRWREGALVSTQESLKERNEEAMDVLRNMSDIETVIRAFRSLELLTEVFPMMYNNSASSIVRRVYVYMSVTNRSISSVEVLKSAASVLVNLARYKVTGPKLYDRERISPILKFMWRYSNSETHLFCILSTYLWLFSKYDDAREDLTEFLHLPEYHKMLVTIKGNVERTKRMASKSRTKLQTPQSCKTLSHTGNVSFRDSMTSNKNKNVVLPALEPDYGITRADKPKYFDDAHQAITCLFSIFKL